MPLYVADRLRTEQNYRGGVRWLRFVFDPTHQTRTDPGAIRSGRWPRLREETPRTATS